MDNAQASDVLKIIEPKLAVWLAWLILVSVVVVDWIKAIKAFPVWAPPAMAFGANVFLSIVLALAIGIPMSGQIAAQCIILATVATVGAIGISALKGKAVPRDDPPAVAAPSPTADEIAALVFEKIQAKVDDEKRVRNYSGDNMTGSFSSVTAPSFDPRHNT